MEKIFYVKVRVEETHYEFLIKSESDEEAILTIEAEYGNRPYYIKETHFDLDGILPLRETYSSFL